MIDLRTGGAFDATQPVSLQAEGPDTEAGLSITEPRKRELAAVMFTDMVGFTALMQHDEHTGIENRTRWTTAMERHHGAVGGEVVQWFGDGALSRFPAGTGS